MNEYTHDLMVFYEAIDGVGPWLWRREDYKGYRWPKEDWYSHKSLVQKYLTKWDVCIQAGGLQGMYPRLYSEMFKTVYTFEPDPLSFFCLTHNCQRDNIVKMQAALGELPGTVGFATIDPNNIGQTKIHPVGTIPMITIDSLNLPKCDFIHLDVEGGELSVLKGAIRTISAYRPALLIEMGQNILGEPNKFLSYLGYSYIDTSCNDALFIRR